MHIRNTFAAACMMIALRADAGEAPVAPPAASAAADAATADLLIGTAAESKEEAPTAKRWYKLTNYPGWMGYGVVNQNGWLTPEEFKADQVTHIVQTAPPSAASYGDPYGFVAWLNGVRATYGLGAVGYDPNLSNWAAMNNNQQASQGLGHHVMGPARRQNSAMGGYPGIETMWMASPAHRAALLDPTITRVGIAGAGAWWTFNAN